MALLEKLLLRASNRWYTVSICFIYNYNYLCTIKSDGTSGVCDNVKSYISWRGDGQYFICSTIDSDTGKFVYR